MIHCKQVSLSYQVGERRLLALDRVDLQVPRGSIFGLIGRSGAGKSSFLRCVNGLEKPTSGSISVAGQDLQSLSPPALRQLRGHIGMVFQHFNLLSRRTVFANIALPLELRGWSRSQIAAKVPSLLKLTGLEALAQHYPHQLSGGQKQRVAIARALATEPQLLLCDEATSALDPQSTVEILQLLRSLQRQLGLTIFLITHEFAVIKALCDYVALMHEGRVVEVQAVSDFIARPQSLLAAEYVKTSLGWEGVPL